MGRIRVMNSELVGRIAAGEVIERPASVVKELLENSIDAGATHIRVNIEMGGQKLIQVIDDGCGMDRQDAMLCLETHATSKITQSGDVGQIITLGFRGEAIPSIASVSRFSLQTRRADETAGSEVLVDFGTIRDVRDCGCAPGTNIRVSQLFANLPARRKFLRGPETEDSFIEEMVRNIALSRPQITITLYLNQREILRTPGTDDIATRVSTVLGKESYQTMLPVDYSEDGVTVRGFIAKPGFTRTNRREQRIFVNGRTATADTIYYAIRDAFDQLVAKGRYPGAVLYVDLAPDRVDVNVHPTKREVRFREPREIGQIISAAIRKALRGMAGGEEFFVQDSPLGPSPAATSALPQPTLQQQPPAPLNSPPIPPAAISQPTPQPSSIPIAPPPAAISQPTPHPSPVPVPQPPPAVLPPVAFAPKDVELPLDLPPKLTAADLARRALASQEPTPEAQTVRSNLLRLRFIGRLGNLYTLAESEGGLVVINLKAAHQRIVFENLLKAVKAESVPQQPLLIPATVTLAPSDAHLLHQELVFFNKLGFQIEPFGGNAFVIAAVPASFPDTDMEGLLRNMLDDLRASTVTNRQSTVHLAQVASRHAIRNLEKLTDEEIRNVISRLLATDMPYTDPWGHPTMLLYSFSEFEHRFH